MPANIEDVSNAIERLITSGDRSLTTNAVIDALNELGVTPGDRGRVAQLKTQCLSELKLVNPDTNRVDRSRVNTYVAQRNGVAVMEDAAAADPAALVECIEMIRSAVNKVRQSDSAEFADRMRAMTVGFEDQLRAADVDLEAVRDDAEAAEKALIVESNRVAELEAEVAELKSQAVAAAAAAEADKKREVDYVEKANAELLAEVRANLAAAEARATLSDRRFEEILSKITGDTVGRPSPGRKPSRGVDKVGDTVGASA